MALTDRGVVRESPAERGKNAEMGEHEKRLRSWTPIGSPRDVATKLPTSPWEGMSKRWSPLPWITCEHCTPSHTLTSPYQFLSLRGHGRLASALPGYRCAAERGGRLCRRRGHTPSLSPPRREKMRTRGKRRRRGINLRWVKAPPAGATAGLPRRRRHTPKGETSPQVGPPAHRVAAMLFGPPLNEMSVPPRHYCHDRTKGHTFSSRVDRFA